MSYLKTDPHAIPQRKQSRVQFLCPRAIRQRLNLELQCQLKCVKCKSKHLVQQNKIEFAAWKLFQESISASIWTKIDCVQRRCQVYNHMCIIPSNSVSKLWFNNWQCLLSAWSLHCVKPPQGAALPAFDGEADGSPDYYCEANVVW